MNLSSIYSIHQISDKIKNGDISPVDLVDVCLNKIKKLNPLLGSFITIVDEQQIYKQAEYSEKEIKQGNYLGPLHGIPFSIKDMIFAKGIRFTAGSRIFANYISKVDATSVKKMRTAGAILMGTNNLNEFASGITGKNPFYGDSKNPWDQERISGGSSGGSAVAVATGMALVSLGTDTGGSIRVPSALCGVVGLKPTYNLISKYNIFPLSPSLDHVGCITKCVRDAAIVLECLSKKNSFNKIYENKKNSAFSKIKNLKNKAKIILGIPETYFFDFIDSEVEYIFYNFVKRLSSYNIRVETIKLHKIENYYKSWRSIRLAEASEIHQAWLNSREEYYSNETRNMLLEGTKISAIEYIQAKHVTKEIRKEFLSLLRYNVDAIIVPTTVIPAPKLNQDSVIVNKDFLINIRKALLRNTIIFNSIGLPAVSIPIGFTRKSEMPVGIQIIGPPFGDNLILSIAFHFECTNNRIFKSIPSIAI
ncbi:MAG: amidase [Thermoproteota archaeon]|nr:amidase [Thermoproteota archaeon]